MRLSDEAFGVSTLSALLISIAVVLGDDFVGAADAGAGRRGHLSSPRGDGKRAALDFGLGCLLFVAPR